MRSIRTLLVMLACLGALAPSAAYAQPPAANGDIVVVRSDNVNSVFAVEEIRPEGGVVSSHSIPGATQVADLRYTNSGAHVAINSRNMTTCGGEGVQCGGAYLGAPDALGGAAAGTLFHPSYVYRANLCTTTASVVATMADGNLLWKREFTKFRYDMPSSTCANTSNGRREVDYLVTTPGNVEVGRSFDWKSNGGSPLGKAFPGDVIGAASEPNVVYSYVAYAQNGYATGYYRVNVVTEQVELLHQTVGSTLSAQDVSPDGRRLVAADGQSVVVFDLVDKTQTTILTAAQADTLLPSTKVFPGAYTALQDAVFSPDGTRIALWRQNTTDGGGRDAVLSIALDGSDGKVLHEVPLGSYTKALAWRPSPGFSVGVDGAQLVGDIVEFDLELRNPRDHGFTNLEFESSEGVNGIVFNNLHYSPENRAKFSLLAGPAPSLPTLLGPKFVSTHQYLVGFDSPGALQVRGKVRATHPSGSRVEVRGSAEVRVEERATSKAERVQIASAAYSDLQEEMYQDSMREFAKTQSKIDAAMKSVLPKSAGKAALAETPLEQTLATNMGLPDDSLSWLPKDPKVAIKAYWSFKEGTNAGETATLKRKLGSAYKFVVGEPWAYWKQQWQGDPATTLSTVDQFVNEAAYYSNTGEAAARTFGRNVHSYVSDPAARTKMNEAALESAVLFEQRMAKVAQLAPAQAKAIAKEFQRDPVAGARKLGVVYGTLRAEAGVAAMETVVGNKLAGAKIVKNIGANLKRFDKAVGHTDEMADAAEELFAPMSAATKASKFDKPPSAAQLGMPKADQTRWQGIVSKLEQHAKDKYGIDLDLELSFRPRNVHSANVKDGAGKNMFMKGKTGTDLDVMLGMDPSGLGKLSIYKPKRPANYAKLDPLQRKEIDTRIKDIEKAYKEWNDPKSALGKAQRAGGVELKASLENGAPVTKLKMQIEGVEKNGTIAVRYNEFIVDGKAIVKKGSKPKWVVSDYDGNAFLQAKGKALPGGAVRGALEAELMRLQREAGVDMPTSFHGFTHNGFDMSAKHYRMNFHFLLEGMTRKEADAAVAMYIRKYAQNADEVKSIMENYKYGDYVVRVTRDAATGGQGI